MKEGDFFGSERSAVMSADTQVKIEFEGKDGSKKTLKSDLSLLNGELVDAAVMSKKALRNFFATEIADAKAKGVMLSLHLKATMMKISDPIIFGHAVSVFLAPVFEKHGAAFKEHAVNPNNGVADMLAKIKTMPNGSEILAEIDAVFASQPNGWAMVDSAKGITNLHVPNDVIIDASMPPLVRDGGKMWNKSDALEDTKAMIPDRSYASIYQAIVDDCRANGQFDHSTTGSVANVGLMAKKAEEYGSHDKTFQMEGSGTVRVIDANSNKVIFEHAVEEGDIYRMCQTKDEPIKDWVKLAVTRARDSGSPAIFWLDQNRAHDAELIKKVNVYLKDHNTDGLEISIMKPFDAMVATCKRARAGQDTISVTGNVLRDYLTDLFPILELGTSAKMLSIVPLLKGGGLFETGAGGSAPKHVQQFHKEGHLRWDSLGEYLAVVVSLEHLAAASGKAEAKTLATTLNAAVGKLLENDKSPSRKVNEIDNRGSTFYVAKYWAEELAKVDKSFESLAAALDANEKTILDDLIKCQGTPVDCGGWFQPDDAKAGAAMRPSATFNSLIDGKN
jgi:isocitrate dehydrogenase